MSTIIEHIEKNHMTLSFGFSAVDRETGEWGRMYHSADFHSAGSFAEILSIEVYQWTESADRIKFMKWALSIMGRRITADGFAAKEFTARLNAHLFTSGQYVARFEVM